jgi:hypothetical protein
MLLACATILTSLAACGAQSDKPSLPGGASSREAVVNSYIEALNTSDAPALRLLSGGSGPPLEAGINRRLTDYGNRHIHLTVTPTFSDFVPYMSGTALSGKMDGGDYHENLGLSKRQDRWFLNLAEPTPAPGTPPLPTANPALPTSR